MDAQPLLQFDVAYPARLSRLLIFVKWLLIIPQIFVLSFVMIGLAVTTFIAWWAILFTGRYPRGLFNFALMTLRWMARVNVYYYLQRDEYPPFGDGAYPMQFDLAYPNRLSRLLIFVKWLLIIPHWIVLYILGLVASIIYFVSWWAILFLGRYPEGMFDFMVGYQRWSYRVMTYILLMTDTYPPFTLSGTPAPASPTAGPELAPRF
ncbi:MAG TPA: DUF4389 domain-containing protein [Thermomicrobiales bacterium]|jgi:hypothetical protein|nr:DUF4389 domain-containing protein [Thermomicrobiales bacterium]